MNSLITRTLARGLLARPAVRTTLSRRTFFVSENSVVHPNNFKKYVPKVEWKGETTLGQVYDGLWTNYRYRAAWPIVAWVVFLWYNLWVPYMPAHEKEKLKERMDYLKSLEFRQDDIHPSEYK
ncbi:hypothetical protein HDV00_008568 [Rhizophlyctis rosea]|nr:hypothetical protein HDV00_008568 [Rhizophlyctis rosea]